MHFSDRQKLSLSMIIFGTIGIVRRMIPLSSAVLACVRGITGALVLLLYAKCTSDGRAKQKPDRKALFGILFSGMLIGINWILLFEAYRFTSVATATLCYYMEPVFVILASPFVLHEKLTFRKLCCLAAAFAGMVLVTGTGEGSGAQYAQNGRGIIMGLAAALLYASVILLNKFIGNMDAVLRTTLQLASAGLVLVPYILLTENLSSVHIGTFALLLTLMAGVVHTGFAYLLYFSSMETIPAQTIAIMSYIDPAVALLLSVFLLKEPFGLRQGIGAVLILSAGFFAG